MIIPYRSFWPKIHETAFVAPSADLIGDIHLGASSSVWFQAVIRGDVNSVRIGDRTNIQDQSVLHVTRKTCSLTIGNNVTIGHRVILHGCSLADRVLVGMGAIILDKASVGEDCLIAAGSLVTQRMKIPPRSLVMGSPARVKRSLTEEELAHILQSAENYVRDSVEYHGYVAGPSRLGSNDSDLEFFSVDDFERSFEND